MLRGAVPPQRGVLVAPEVSVPPGLALVHAHLPVGGDPGVGGAVVGVAPGAHVALLHLVAPGVGQAVVVGAGVGAGLPEGGVGQGQGECHRRRRRGFLIAVVVAVRVAILVAVAVEVDDVLVRLRLLLLLVQRPLPVLFAAKIYGQPPSGLDREDSLVVDVALDSRFPGLSLSFFGQKVEEMSGSAEADSAVGRSAPEVVRPRPPAGVPTRLARRCDGWKDEKYYIFIYYYIVVYYVGIYFYRKSSIES